MDVLICTCDPTAVYSEGHLTHWNMSNGKEHSKDKSQKCLKVCERKRFLCAFFPQTD